MNHLNKDETGSSYLPPNFSISPDSEKFFMPLYQQMVQFAHRFASHIPSTIKDKIVSETPHLENTFEVCNTMNRDARNNLGATKYTFFKKLMKMRVRYEESTSEQLPK